MSAGMDSGAKACTSGGDRSLFSGTFAVSNVRLPSRCRQRALLDVRKKTLPKQRPGKGALCCKSLHAPSPRHPRPTGDPSQGRMEHGGIHQAFWSLTHGATVNSAQSRPCGDEGWKGELGPPFSSFPAQSIKLGVGKFRTASP